MKHIVGQHGKDYTADDCRSVILDALCDEIKKRHVKEWWAPMIDRLIESVRREALEEARKALSKYGQHLPDCYMERKAEPSGCDCGFWDAKGEE